MVLWVALGGFGWLFGLLWENLGGGLGEVWGFLGIIWGDLGQLLGVIWGDLGQLLGSSGVILANFGGHLG